MPPPDVTLTFGPYTSFFCQAQAHTRPSLGKILLKVLHSPGFFRDCATVTYDFLIPKSNQHIYECKYIYNQNWIKLSSVLHWYWRYDVVCLP